jgi:protein involved in polysaccharide export with SLBB domain
MWLATAVLGCFCSGCLTTSRLGVSDPSLASAGLAGAAATGGAVPCLAEGTSPQARPPAELTKTSLPAYRIEAPDVLLIEGVRLAPKAPYLIAFQDILQIVVSGVLPEQPIANTYLVDSGGNVDLGPSYGVVRIQGLTLDEATDAISRHLRSTFQTVEVSVVLIQPAGQQVIGGEHLVAPDGTINLGIYGTVFVMGMTVDEARRTIESHLSEYFDEPSVSVEVFSYASKYYYVITEGPGDGVVNLPITGNETVLDAVAAIGGLGQAANKRIWISRPAPPGTGCDQVLPVDWDAIVRGADTCTNYQLLPGDRVFIAANRLVLVDAFVSKVLNPFERVFGFTLLGTQSIQSLQRFPRGFNF